MNNSIRSGAIIKLTEGCALILGEIVDTKTHSHHALQISIAVKGEYSIETGGISAKTNYAIVDSDKNHRIYGDTHWQLLLLVEPESMYGHAIKEKLNSNTHLIEGLDDGQIERLSTILAQGQVSLKETIPVIFSILGILMCFCQKKDPRIERVLDLIASGGRREPSVKKLSRLANLSESRMQHLFKDYTGISIKRYILWKRLINAISIITEGRDLTLSSHLAGFFDSAHLSRSFKSMFGIRPSDVFKGSRSIQVIKE